jgi:hypothetical protein
VSHQVQEQAVVHTCRMLRKLFWLISLQMGGENRRFRVRVYAPILKSLWIRNWQAQQRKEASGPVVAWESLNGIYSYRSLMTWSVLRFVCFRIPRNSSSATARANCACVVSSDDSFSPSGASGFAPISSSVWSASPE